MAGRPILNFLPGFFCLLSLVLVLLVLLAGVNNSLSTIYYLKTDLSNFKAPAKLSGSDFLKDISTVSGADLVGQSATADSLGLAQSYTISLLTSCAHATDGSVTCTPPHIGFSFDPSADLNLASTGLGSNATNQQLVDAISAYKSTSGFLAAAYILSIALLVLTPLIGFFGSRGGAITATVLSTLTTVFLLAAGIAGGVIFRRLNGAFNDNFSAAGITSSIGNVPASLGFSAFCFSLVASIIYGARARDPSLRRRRSGRGRGLSRGLGGSGDSKALITGDVEGFSDGPAGQRGFGGEGTGPGGEDPSKKPGLWGRMPTWTSHKYVQVGKQPAVVRTDVMGNQQAVRFESPGGEDVRRKLQPDDWSADDHEPEEDYSAPLNPAAHGGDGPIAMRNMSSGAGSNKKERDLDTAYEPYSSTTTVPMPDGGH